MDLLPVNLTHDYAPKNDNLVAFITLTAKITRLNGTVFYWTWDADENPRWAPDNGYEWQAALWREGDNHFINIDTYEFSSIINMERPKRNNEYVPLWKDKYGYWLELPAFYCDLEIWIGTAWGGASQTPHIIMRNFSVEQVGEMEVFAEEN
jgi:hypothetical protein